MTICSFHQIVSSCVAGQFICLKEGNRKKSIAQAVCYQHEIVHATLNQVCLAHQMTQADLIVPQRRSCLTSVWAQTRSSLSSQLPRWLYRGQQIGLMTLLRQVKDFATCRERAAQWLPVLDPRLKRNEQRKLPQEAVEIRQLGRALLTSLQVGVTIHAWFS